MEMAKICEVSVNFCRAGPSIIASQIPSGEMAASNPSRGLHEEFRTGSFNAFVAKSVIFSANFGIFRRACAWGCFHGLDHAPVATENRRFDGNRPQRLVTYRPGLAGWAFGYRSAARLALATTRENYTPSLWA